MISSQAELRELVEICFAGLPNLVIVFDAVDELKTVLI